MMLLWACSTQASLIQYSEWLLLIIKNWYQPQCQGMLTSTALLHNEYAWEGVVALPEYTVHEGIAVIKSTEVQEPMRCPDSAAQSATVAGIV